MPSIIKAINPETQRRIAVNGPTFNGLIKKGWRYNGEENILHRVFLAHVTIIVKYSIVLKTKRLKKFGSFPGLNLCRFYQIPKKLMKFSISDVCRTCIKSDSRTSSYFAQQQYLAELPFEIITDYEPWRDRGDRFKSYYYYWKEDDRVKLNEYNGIPHEKKDEWYKQKIQAGQQKMLDVCIRDMTYKIDPTTDKNYVYEILIECPSYQFHKNNGGLTGITSDSLEGLHRTLAGEYHNIGMNVT
ncbi:unnamed protein product [Rhizophagus irregularis]|uniref:Uncharacterized protein n=1 Tax=Rhizophagus irregularis TaxID=588596 RepID=A0A915ZQR3_9GLOM|nr:unnamed protein product [Rhizophagus irregularis]CAB5383527.1 unnamed protein product [Rhizophagus irregularis]